MIDSYYAGYPWINSLWVHPTPQCLLTTIIPPICEPVSYADLAAYLRLDETYDESLVTSLGIAARYFFELSTKLTLMETTYSVTYDWFAQSMKLPRRPATNVLSVTYIDQNGATQTLSPTAYRFDQKSIFSWVRPTWGTVFPQTGYNPNSVTIEFTAGTGYDDEYGTIYDVDELSKTAIKMIAGHFYDNRQAVSSTQMSRMPYGLEAILDSLNAPEIL